MNDQWEWVQIKNKQYLNMVKKIILDLSFQPKIYFLEYDTWIDMEDAYVKEFLRSVNFPISKEMEYLYK